MVGAYYSWIIRISYLYSNYNKVLSVVPVRLRWRLLLVIAIRSIAQIVAASGKVTKFSILSYPRCVDSAVMLVFFSRCLPSLTVRHSSEMPVKPRFHKILPRDNCRNMLNALHYASYNYQ
ncbi:uncharacterized protein LOC126901350 isoform X2 [Daktulosphaira vitifoliae]|uniref:uncharacterized protein LOC126901350 isoform X2 n=1 Tax=Daktulosphaira vitifoliae TaxID=58002 RepID=UPI0021AAD511|nr:uncharacterized protein LOC126901350 isoform X2 [Daktulosphaira vitifoliae]